MDPDSIASVFVGALVTWLVTRIYYERASKDLREEAAKLREAGKKTHEILEIMGRGNIRLEKNEWGETVKVILLLTSTDEASLSESSGVEKSPPGEK